MNLKIAPFGLIYCLRERLSCKAVPISKSLPLKDEAFGPLVSRAFFENLLPPEVVLRKLEKILHHDRRNTFAFLKELGGDCAGAVSLCPEDVELGNAEGSIRELSDGLVDAMDDVATELADTGHPLPLYKEISAQSQRRLMQLV